MSPSIGGPRGRPHGCLCHWSPSAPPRLIPQTSPSIPNSVPTDVPTMGDSTGHNARPHRLYWWLPAQPGVIPAPRLAQTGGDKGGDNVVTRGAQSCRNSATKAVRILQRSSMVGGCRLPSLSSAVCQTHGKGRGMRCSTGTPVGTRRGGTSERGGELCGMGDGLGTLGRGVWGRGWGGRGVTWMWDMGTQDMGIWGWVDMGTWRPRNKHSDMGTRGCGDSGLERHGET